MRTYFLTIAILWGGCISGLSAVDRSSMVVSLGTGDNPIKARTFIVDPEGRKFGQDPQTGTFYSDIPNIGYDKSSIAADDGSGGATPESEVFYIQPVAAGSYTFVVHAVESASYILGIGIGDAGGKAMVSLKKKGHLESSNADVYRLTLDPAPGAPAPVLVKVGDDPFLLEPFAAQLLGVCESLTAGGNARISGLVHAGGTVSLSGNAKIVGDVTAAGVTTSGNGKVEGTVTTASGPFNCAPVDLAAVAAQLGRGNDNAKIPAKHLKNGVLTLKGNDKLTLPAGKYLVQGVELSGNAKLAAAGAVRILALGNMDLSGNAKVEGDLMVFTDAADVSISGNGSLSGVLYAPKAVVDLAGSGKALGRVMAKGLKASGNAKIE